MTKGDNIHSKFDVTVFMKIMILLGCLVFEVFGDHHEANRWRKDHTRSVRIEPKTVTAKAGTYVNFTCAANRGSIINIYRDHPHYQILINAPPSEKRAYREFVVRVPDCHIKSIRVTCTVCIDDTLFLHCSSAEITIERDHPFRQCPLSRPWERPLDINCASPNIGTGYREKVTKVMVTSVELLEKTVESLSKDWLSSVKLSKTLTMHKLANAVDDMNQLSNIIIDSRTTTNKGVVVSETALQNFAKLADTIMSSDTEIKEEFGVMETPWFTNYSDYLGKSDDAVDNFRTKSSYQNIGNKLLLTMEILTKSTLDNLDFASEVIEMENIMIKRGRVNGTTIYFPESKDEKESWSLNGRPKAVFFNNKSADVRYAIILYKNWGKTFLSSGQVAKRKQMEGFDVASEVLSFSINPNKKYDMLSDISIQFLPSLRQNFEPTCSYLSTDAFTFMEWTSEYCVTEKTTNGAVNCHCLHLTNFAVLLKPFGALVFDPALDITTFVGIVVSIVCLILTLFTYALLWSHVRGTRSSLHVCLSACLLLAYILFLVGIERTDNKTLCLMITISLHYFLLCCFSIMFIEGLELYIQVNVVFFSRKLFDWKTLALAFSVPFVIVGITVMSTWNKGYRNKEFCWLNVESGALWSFLGPIIFVVVANILFATLVFKAMLSTRFMDNLQIRKKVKTILKAICVITPSLGLTWTFGLVAVNTDVYFFNYMFAILNSLQGLFIFIFQCLLVTEIRNWFYVRFSIISSQYLASHSSKSQNLERNTSQHLTTINSKNVEEIEENEQEAMEIKEKTEISPEESEL